MVDMDPIMALAKQHNVFVIEDAAEAHGALYKGKKAGSIGDISCFSFYANKIITTGEGGMLVTNSGEYAGLARRLKDLAHGAERFTHDLPEAFNYRMTNIQAAIGLGQLERADEIVDRKIANAHYYNELLADQTALTLPICHEWAKNVYWMYGVVVTDNSPLTKKQWMEALSAYGVDTRSFFYPHDQQTAFAAYAKTPCKHAAYLGEHGFYLPSGLALTKQDIEQVAAAITSILKEHAS
jgi:perosamine synthetase